MYEFIKLLAFIDKSIFDVVIIDMHSVFMKGTNIIVSSNSYLAKIVGGTSP
jgi:hypothetical protein